MIAILEILGRRPSSITQSYANYKYWHSSGIKELRDKTDVEIAYYAEYSQSKLCTKHIMCVYQLSLFKQHMIGNFNCYIVNVLQSTLILG